MSRETLINQGKSVYENIKNLDQRTLLANPGNLQPWNNMDFNDFVESYNDMLFLLNGVYEDNVLDNMPFNLINAMNSTLNTVLQHLTTFISNRAQGQFQNAFAQIESLRTNVQQWGFRYETILSKSIEEKSKVLDSEITNVLSSKAEVEKLKTTLEGLIEPAVAGTLSKSFDDRKKALHTNQSRWFWVSVGMALIGVIATASIVISIVGLFGSKDVLMAIEKSKNGVDGVIWTTIGLRIGVLLPIYSIFGFSFIQYKKERDLEEEYAHKAAVASSLTSYGGIAVEDNVKDQILSEASKVIFTSPSQKAAKGDSAVVGQLNSLLSNLQKLIPKSKD